jgi:hypothetical protein
MRRVAFIASTIAVAGVMLLGAEVVWGQLELWGLATSSDEPRAEGEPTPAQFAPIGDVPRLSGTPAAAASALARRYESVVGVRLQPPHPTTEDAPGGLSPEAQDGPMLSIDVAVPGSGPAAFARPVWEAYVFAGALNDRLAASGEPRLGGIDITLIRPDGTAEPIGGGLGLVVPGQRFGEISPAVTEEIGKRADAQGLESIHLETLAGIDQALVLEAVAPSVNVVQKLSSRPGGTFRALLGAPPGSYEGVYVAIRDRTGKALYIQGAASRIGWAFAWADPSSGISVGRGFAKP